MSPIPGSASVPLSLKILILMCITYKSIYIVLNYLVSLGLCLLYMYTVKAKSGFFKWNLNKCTHVLVCTAECIDFRS